MLKGLGNYYFFKKNFAWHQNGEASEEHSLLRSCCSWEATTEKSISTVVILHTSVCRCIWCLKKGLCLELWQGLLTVWMEDGEIWRGRNLVCALLECILVYKGSFNALVMQKSASGHAHHWHATPRRMPIWECGPQDETVIPLLLYCLSCKPGLSPLRVPESSSSSSQQLWL